jgi:hypothetical protein
MTIEDLARQVFEELGLSHYTWYDTWYEYVDHLDEFLEVLFFMYFARREPNALGNDSTCHTLY